MSPVTGKTVPVFRVTESAPLSTPPTGIVSAAAPPSITPLVTLTGSVTVNGAPVATTALNWPIPADSKDTTTGKGSTELPSRLMRVSAVRPENTPAGRLLSWLPYRSRRISAVSPENTPAGRLLSRLTCR